MRRWPASTSLEQHHVINCLGLIWRDGHGIGLETEIGVSEYFAWVSDIWDRGFLGAAAVELAGIGMKLVCRRVIGGTVTYAIILSTAPSLIATFLFLSVRPASRRPFRPGDAPSPVFQARPTSWPNLFERRDMSRVILDLSGKKPRAQQVGELLRLELSRLGIEELVGELAAAAQPSQTDLGAGDQAVAFGLLSRDQRLCDFIVQALATGRVP